MRLLRGRTSITRSVVSGVGPASPVLRVRDLFWWRRACWVSALASGGIKSIHQFITRSDLEKKRCPPISMRLPLWRMGREMPPISWLAVSPAGPAPMSKAVLGMNTPAAYDRRPQNDEAHLPRGVACPINNTVTGESLYGTLHSRWSKAPESG